jgi:uncharacterized membrane protein YphA (DoxX/SURF4 family)
VQGESPVTMPVINNKQAYKISIILIALVWLLNGLFCKVLNLVPRHEMIVARILGNSHAELFTKLIGATETLMAIWILSGIKSRLNSLVQILIIAVMNCIEFVLAPDLLLWERFNAVFALLFIIFIYYNELRLKSNLEP